MAGATITGARLAQAMAVTASPDQAGGELAEQVGGGRCQDDRIGGLGQLDVRDLLVGVELEHVVEHGSVRERLEREPADEAARGGGHCHVDHGASLGQHPHQHDRLVGGDAAGHADDDAAPGERPEPLGHASVLRAVRAGRSRSRSASHAYRMPRSVRSGSKASMPGTSWIQGWWMCPPVATTVTRLPVGLALDQLAAQGGEQAADEPDVAEHDARLHGVDRVRADGARRPPQLDPRQLARATDEGLEAERHAGRDGAADVGAVGVDEVEVRARAEVDDDGRPAELDPSRQRVRQPVGAGLRGPVDADGEDALERGGVDDDRLEPDALGDEPLPRLGQGRHDAGDRHRVELVEPVRVEGEHPGEHRGDLVRGRVGARDGAPRARQPIVLEQADGDVRVADVGRQQLHAAYRSSRSDPHRPARGPVLDSPHDPQRGAPMSEARAKLYINTGVVTGKSDIYNILRPLLKQTVSYTYHRGSKVESSGTGWVERIVVDHPDVASYFTPLAICLNLDSFDYLQFDTTSEQLLIYTLVIGNERVVLEFAASGAQRLAELSADADAAAVARGRALPRNTEELARDLRFIQMELLMSAEAEASDGERVDEDEDGA